MSQDFCFLYCFTKSTKPLIRLYFIAVYWDKVRITIDLETVQKRRSPILTISYYRSGCRSFHAHGRYHCQALSYVCRSTCDCYCLMWRIMASRIKHEPWRQFHRSGQRSICQLYGTGEDDKNSFQNGRNTTIKFELISINSISGLIDFTHSSSICIIYQCPYIQIMYIYIINQ